MQRPSHLTRHRHLKHLARKTGHHHTYINLSLMGLGILVTVFLAQSAPFADWVLGLNVWGMALIGGILFTISFLAPIGCLILAILLRHTAMIPLVVVSGIGAVIADLTIVNSINTELLEEIEDIVNQFHGKTFFHIFQSSVFRWTLPLIIICILVTPLPDSLAVGLMGMSRLTPRKFLLSSYILNSAGIVVMIGLFLFSLHI